MKAYLRYFVCLAALILVATCSQAYSSTDELTSWEKAYLSLEKTARENSGSEDRARLVSETYARRFGSIRAMDLSGQSSRDLHALFKAAASTEFYDPTEDHLSDMRAVFEILQERKDASSGEVSTFYSSLFLGRAFDEMSAFYRSHSSDGLPPPVSFAGQRGSGDRHVVLDVAATGNGVLGRRVDLNRSTRIVVIAHPQCHFTRQAVTSIEADPSLREVISTRAIWVAPPDRNVDLSPFREWNKAHRSIPISIAYSGADWPEVRIWQTPTFLLFREGRLTGEVVGWPEEGNAERLRIELSKLGLSGSN